MAGSGVRAYQGGAMMKRMASVLVLLAVVGVGQADDKGIIERLKESGGQVTQRDVYGEKDALEVAFVHNTPQKGSLVELCELRRLRALAFVTSRVTDAEMRTVGSLTSLRVLHLASTEITDEGVKELTGLYALQQLYLNDSERITDASIDSIARMSGLKRLFLPGTSITDEGVARLQKALPKCQIRR
jgi:hypothetical protein